jgi:hypothetical protein
MSVAATAPNGGIPTVALDVPISAVLIGLFVPLAAGHMIIFRRNLSRGHKFLFSALCFGYCMSRIAANALRIALATHPGNIGLTIAATILLNAGVLIAYIINNLFAWRMVRSADPAFGWKPALVRINKAMLWLILPMFLPLVVIIILSFVRPDLPGVPKGAQVLGRLVQTYFVILTVEPAFLVAYAHYKHQRTPPDRMDELGTGSWRAKVVILAITIAAAITSAGFRCGTAWEAPRLFASPAWYQSKPAFYLFNFGLDIVILATFLVGRIDRRFWVPNGAKGPGSYAREADVSTR